MAIGTTGLVVTVAAVAAAAGAGTALVVVETSRPPAPASAPADSAAVSGLEDKFARQEKEIADLRARLEETEASQSAAPVHDGGSSGGARIGDSPAVASNPGASSGPGTAAPDAVPSSPALDSLSPAEKTKFETFYREMKQREQDDQKKTRIAAMEAGLRARLDRLPETLGLTPAQKDTVVKNLMDRADRTRALLEEARETGGPEAFRAAQEKTSALRQESRQALAAILTPEQLRAVDGADRDSGTPGALRTNDRAGRRNVGGGNGGGGQGGNRQNRGQGGDAGGDAPK